MNEIIPPLPNLFLEPDSRVCQMKATHRTLCERVSAVKGRPPQFLFAAGPVQLGFLFLQALGEIPVTCLSRHLRTRQRTSLFFGPFASRTPSPIVFFQRREKTMAGLRSNRGQLS